MLSAPDTLRLHTAENVGIDYRIAGLGSRFLALLIDNIVLVPIELVLGIGAWVLLSGGATTNQGLLMAAALTGVIVLFGRSCYFILLEGAGGGQTPGKRALSVRVVRETGGGIGFTESVIRNLVRSFEELLLNAPAVVSMFADRRSRRLGDLAAGTMVVHERRPAGPRHGPPAPAFAAPPVYLHVVDGGPPIAGLQALGQRDHSFLRSFLSRLDLHPAQRQRLAADIAAKLCERMSMPADSAERSQPPELVLERLYLQLSQHLGARP